MANISHAYGRLSTPHYEGFHMTTYTDGYVRAEKQTYSVDQAAELLGISRGTAYDAVKTGELPVIRLGKRLLVPKAALDRMLDGAAAA